MDPALTTSIVALIGAVTLLVHNEAKRRRASSSSRSMLGLGADPGEDNFEFRVRSETDRRVKMHDANAGLQTVIVAVDKLGTKLDSAMEDFTKFQIETASELAEIKARLYYYPFRSTKPSERDNG